MFLPPNLMLFEGLYNGIDWGGGMNSMVGPARYELMQFTGLKDKNGKEIYEDDIVSSPRHPGLATISYCNAAFRVFCEQNGWIAEILEENTGASEEDELDSDELIIVGNIHENPELLKP